MLNDTGGWFATTSTGRVQATAVAAPTAGQTLMFDVINIQ